MGMGLANYMSRRSRAKTGTTEEIFLGEENEWLIIYCKEILQQKNIDFFVFGHRHLPIDFRLNDSRAVILILEIGYDILLMPCLMEMKCYLKSYKGNDDKIIRN